jgi:hypothetical protein
MKLISIETLCRGVTAFGGRVRGEFQIPSERPDSATVRLICQMGLYAIPSDTFHFENREGQMTEKEFEAHGIKFTASIEVRKMVRRTDLPEFCIEHFGEVIDLRPVAAEVLTAYPLKVDLDVGTLAELCIKRSNGKYIRVGEYPDGVERGIVEEIISRMRGWLAWPRQKEELVRFSRYFPDRRFQCDETACDEAKAMNGDLVSQRGPVRLPLKTCWGRGCYCTYRLVKRDRTEV